MNLSSEHTRNVARVKPEAWPLIGLFCLKYKMFLLFGNGEKETTLQPENRQEQDVIFYFKISAFARFQVMFQISASAIPPSHALITCIHRCSIYSCVAAGPTFGKKFRGPWFIRLASESRKSTPVQLSQVHDARRDSASGCKDGLRALLD